MTDLAQEFSTEPGATARSRAVLAVVENDPDPVPATDVVDASTAISEPNLGRAGMVGYAVGFLVATVAITLVGTLGGLGFGNSLGLGAFVGLWGGGGFGFMLGATIPFAKHLDAQSARSNHHYKETSK
jgi:hypothetical protein